MKFFKIIIRSSVALILFSIMLTTVYAENDLDFITYNDANLKDALIDFGIDINADGEITKSELESLSGELDLSNKNITDITGLEYATGITGLNLMYDNLTDITPVQNLINLKTLTLYSTVITDVTPLSKLANLESLNLYINKNTDISVLNSLENLINSEINKMAMGIDVSYANGIVDWQKVKEASIDFAIIRCGYGNDLTDQDDTFFEENIKGVTQAGIPYGIYLYSYATNLEEAESEVQHILRQIKDKSPTYPIYIDMEDSDGYKKERNVSNQMCVDISEYVCERLIQSGYYAGIYSNKYWLDTRINDSKLDRFDKWLAQWSHSPTYSKDFGIWQYTPEGKVDGIKGFVDMNIAFVDYPSVITKIPLKGDINGDDQVTVSDVVALRKIIMGGTYNEIADLNEDGIVSVTDVVTLRQLIMGNYVA